MADQQFHASPGTTTATEVTPATDDMKHGRYDIAEEPNKGVKDLANLDEASRFLHEHHVSDARMTELSQDTTALRKLRRRTDLLLLPLLCGTYFLQFIDKQAMGYGAVFDLFNDTHVSINQYSWLASIFYFAYLVSEWPASYLAQHFPTGKVISIAVVCWGIILTCTAACSSFTGLAICRFLLGVFEAPITPCFMMIISMWYQRAEQPSRAGFFYCFNGFGLIVGGALFYAIGQEKGWAVWRAIFVLCGGTTIVWGVVLWFFLPDNIFQARGFTTDEKVMLLARVKDNQTGVLNRRIKSPQVKEALLDPQVWVLFLYILLNEVINGGIANFGPLIVKGFSGDNALLTTAYGIPFGAWVTLFMFTGPYLASKFKNIRTIIMAVYQLPTIVAACLLWKLDRHAKKNAGLLMAYYISPGYVGGLVIGLQMPAVNTAGYTKRVTSTAVVFLVYCAGNIIGPHAFVKSQAPVYQDGCQLIIACAVGQIVLAAGLRWLLISRNKTRDRAALAEGEELGGAQDAGVESIELNDDLTDFENWRFRYSY